MLREIELSETSDSRTAGYQRWQKLAFIHWKVPAEILQPLIPRELTIEQFDGSAWLGVVPFSMEAIRPWWSPPVPGVSWFLETNVRTYVVDQRGVRGVWFFSLDANKQMAVTVARTFWHLPYKMASLSLRDAVDEQPAGKRRQIRYEGHRTDHPGADYSISVQLNPNSVPRTAVAGTLDHFLVERYILFAKDGAGRLVTGEVHHEPYRIVDVESWSLAQSLTAAMGCEIHADQAPDHVAFSEGVSVRVSPLRTSK